MKANEIKHWVQLKFDQRFLLFQISQNTFPKKTSKGKNSRGMVVWLRMSAILMEDLIPYQNKAKSCLELKLSLGRKSRGSKNISIVHYVKIS